MTKIILYIATSLDGFIADADSGVDWLPQPQSSEDLEALGYSQLLERIDTIVMGSRSYKQILTFGEWAWSDKHTYVFTSQAIENPMPCITIINNNPTEFIEQMRNSSVGKDIWLLGGAEFAQSFVKDHLIDEVILTIVPQRLGNGMPLGLSFDDFYLSEETQLIDGMVQQLYLRRGA